MNDIKSNLPGESRGTCNPKSVNSTIKVPTRAMLLLLPLAVRRRTDILSGAAPLNLKDTRRLTPVVRDCNFCHIW